MNLNVLEVRYYASTITWIQLFNDIHSLGCNHAKVTKSLNLMDQKDQTVEKERNYLDYLGPSHVDNL